MRQFYNPKNFIRVFFFRGSSGKGMLLLLFCVAALTGCGKGAASLSGEPFAAGKKTGNTTAVGSELPVNKPEPPVRRAGSGILLPLTGSAAETPSEKQIDLRSPFLPPFANALSSQLAASGRSGSHPTGDTRAFPSVAFSAAPFLTGIFQQNDDLLALLSWGANSGVFARGETLKNGYYVAQITPQTVVLRKSSRANSAGQQGAAEQGQPDNLTLRMKEDGIL